MWIIIAVIGVCLAFMVWKAFLDPNRCTCGAPEWLQFGMWVDHAPDCPARRTEKG